MEGRGWRIEDRGGREGGKGDEEVRQWQWIEGWGNMIEKRRQVLKGKGKEIEETNRSQSTQEGMVGLRNRD